MCIECYFTCCPHHDRLEPICGQGACTASGDDLAVYAMTRAREVKLWQLEKELTKLRVERDHILHTYYMSTSNPTKDLACSKCYPNGNLVQEDFVCFFHRGETVEGNF